MLKKYDEFTEPYDQTKEKEHLKWRCRRVKLNLSSQSNGILTIFPFEPQLREVVALYTD